jgi:hypothetical protein
VVSYSCWYLFKRPKDLTGNTVDQVGWASAVQSEIDQELSAERGVPASVRIARFSDEA